MAVAAVAIAGCAASDGGIASDAALGVYLSVPLSGPQAAAGRAIADSAQDALDEAGGKAGSHPLQLHVLDDTGGGPDRTQAQTGANARTATEDADTIAYIGELDEAATRTSLPITDLAGIAQIVLGPVPTGLDVANLIDARSVHGRDPGAAVIELLIRAIEKAGDDGGDREKVLDELKAEAVNQAG